MRPPRVRESLTHSPSVYFCTMNSGIVIRRDAGRRQRSTTPVDGVGEK